MKASTSKEGSMLNRTLKPSQRTRLWFVSPDYLVDRFLDHIEKLGSLVLPAKAANPPTATEIQARLEQLGA
jgi:hypothetical protein